MPDGYAQARKIVFPGTRWRSDTVRMKTILLATIDPSALPALRIAGALFLAVNVLAGAYVIRHWRRLFAPDPEVDGDVRAVRLLRITVIIFPLTIVTFRLLSEWVELWFK